jgi:ADP-ribose pyrophosphatase
MIEPWNKLDSTPQGDYYVFNVRQDRVRAPEGGTHDFYVIESNDWVNVIPLTADGQVVCIRQFRHGTEAVTLEIPGGMVDPGESPAAAAARELLEETGYEAEAIVPLGAVDPNPAIQNNRCHTYLAKGACRVAEQALDGTEDIDVDLVDLDAIPRLITSGRITHALVVVAFYLFDQHHHTEKRPDRPGG